ncbi:LamG-like jellyroll fold domain-containing protein [Leptospira ilyithenensis]|uniref:Concanavalin n=1 Tax=Leptospira ilyithenensis TaxID=2484901 RepID=A0A4R9LV93_9LEPT|nr:LamG-like jellyroll fold domain-containing protein [Leptospira ilyithenensis]TGN14598.1 concanavalin [Leptospira ilyithenensis]
MKSKAYSYLVFICFFYSCIPALDRSPLEVLSYLRLGPKDSSSHSIGGVVSGLDSNTSITLTNAGEAITLNSDQNFSFPTKLKTAMNYSVEMTVNSASGLTCSIANNAGTVQTTDITNVSVTCGLGPDYYEVGVNVTGLTGTFQVQNNAGNTKSITSSGLNKFTTRIRTGSAYSVSILTQPPGQHCSFEDFTLSVGTIPSANVTIFINCQTGYLLAGALHSVASSDLGTSLQERLTFVRTVAGSFPTNVGGPGPAFAYTDGPASTARFSVPTGITTDGSYIYVADYSNHLIRKISISTGVVSTVAGGNTGGGVTCPGATTVNCLDGVGTAARFYNPIGLTTDGTNLYVNDYLGHRVRKILLATGNVSTITGTGNAGAADGTGTAASFNSPTSLAIYDNHLYIVDRSNFTIRKMNLTTSVVTTIAGSAGISSHQDNVIGTNARFIIPTSVAAFNGYLYVSDIGGHRIRRVELSSGNYAVTTIAGNGVGATKDGIGTTAQFFDPAGIVTDGTDLLIAEFSGRTIRHLRLSDNKVTTVAGNIAGGYADNAGTNGLMNEIGYITTDGLNIYFTDQTNGSIRRLEPSMIAKYTFDGNANDSVGSNHGGLVGTPALASDENGNTTGAYDLNGASQYVNTSALTTTDTINLTISAWVFHRGSPSTQFIFYNGTGNTNGYGLTINATTNSLSVSLGGVGATSGTALGIPLHTWTHVALVRNGINWEIYINGKAQGVAYTVNPIALTGSFKVGDSGGGYYLNGKVSDVRFFKGALDEASLQKLATQVPSGLVAYYPFTSNLNDLSGNGNHLSLSTGVTTYVNDRFGQTISALNMNGSTHFEKASPVGIPTGNSSRTNCAWAKTNSVAGQNIVSYGVATVDNANGIFVNGANILNYALADDLFGEHNNILHRWIHICGTYDGTTASIYFNGVFVSSSPKPLWLTSPSTVLRIGTRVDVLEHFSGILDDIRIYNRVLSLNEIRAMSGYYPAQVAGLQFHLQADSFSAGPVTSWVDTSPNNISGNGGNALTSFVGTFNWIATGINSKPAVQFTGTPGEYLSKTTAPYYGLSSDDFSFFIVQTRGATTGTQTAVNLGPATGGKQFYFDDPVGLSCNTGVPVASTFALHNAGTACLARSNTGFSTLGQGRIFSMHYDSVSAITSPFYWDTNGAEGVTIPPLNTFTAPSAGVLTGIYIGSLPAGLQPYNGNIAEVLYFNRVLTATERDQVHCYLSAKYNIRVANDCQ